MLGGLLLISGFEKHVQRFTESILTGPDTTGMLYDGGHYAFLLCSLSMYMAAIIELELSPEEFALEETLTTIPEAQIEIERVVADAPDRLIPYIWVCTDDFDAFEATLEDDPTAESTTILSETDEERSYEMSLTGSIDLVIRLLTEHEGTITHVDGSADGWHLGVVFPDRDLLSQACNSTRDDGFRFDVERCTIQRTRGTFNMDSQRNSVEPWLQPLRQVILTSPEKSH